MNQPLSRADKLTALCLEAGEPLSAREVAQRVGISERQVVRCRAKLVELGVLEVIEPPAGPRAGRYRRPNGALYGSRWPYRTPHFWRDLR